MKTVTAVAVAALMATGVVACSGDAEIDTADTTSVGMDTGMTGMDTATVTGGMDTNTVGGVDTTTTGGTGTNSFPGDTAYGDTGTTVR